MAKTFVLMHGAWHGGWAWKPVATHLEAEGHVVHAPTAPGLSVDDDPTGVGITQVADYVAEYIEARDLKDVVLVGHSWGGFILSSVAERLKGRLERLVYFNAFVPKSGEALVDLVPSENLGLFEQLAEASANNSVLLPLEIWQSAFMQDAGEEARTLAHSLMVPQPYGTFTDRLGAIDYSRLGVPTSYVFSPEDLAQPPGEHAWFPRFADRLKDPRVVQTVGGHESLFTQQRAVGSALMEAAAD